MKWIVLLCINILFYISAGVSGFVVLTGSILLTYIAGVALNHITKYRRLLCTVYIVLQIIILFGFKYHLFFDIMAPLAISYYTLTSVGYVIDVYRGKYKAQGNLFKLMCVISFFPLMAQGPICRYDELERDIMLKGKINFGSFTYGLTRICYGALKKLVVAERLSIVFYGLSDINDNGTMIAINVLVYAFYLYSDFSGGIDIAIGMGQLFGVGLPENFNSPFFSVSISDYWRRWHISLGTWLKDYVFYPVSFSKPVVKLSKKVRGMWGNAAAKKVPVYVASLLVWFVTGIWHGMEANFILWGMLNAVIILISYELEPLYARFGNRFSFTRSKLYSVFRVLRTFMLMGVLRMLDYTTVPEYFKSLYLIVTDFRISSLVDGSLLKLGIGMADYVVILLGILVMFVVGLAHKNTDYKTTVLSKGIVLSYVVIAVMIAVIIIFGMYGIGYEGKEFIYIRY